ncbi:MAG: cation:proton antiporter [Candidatus Thermoplasmatota archaeon]
MASAAPIFVGIAALTFAGFLAGRFFERTRFPDIPILLGLGLLIGPVNRWLVERGTGSQGLARTLDIEGLQSAAPFIVGLALVVLLFDSGMQLDFKSVKRSIGPAAVHTLPIFLFTVLGVMVVAHLVFGMPILLAGMLGVALSNVDQTVSAGILPHLRIDPDLRTMYTVEMALYDLASIPLIVALIEAAGGGSDLGGGVPGFAALVSVSFAIGIAGGLAWIYALRGLAGHPHSYMLTFAMTLVVYGAAEVLGGSGALSILLFGLLVGNRTWILRRFGHLRQVDQEHEKVQAFHDEITFFVRTLYFLFLGASVTAGAAAWPGIPVAGLGSLSGAALFVIASFGIVGTVILARWVPVRLAAIGRPSRRALYPVFGRGLDTAVLVTLPFVASAYVPGTPYHDELSPWQPVFTNLAFLAILLTVFASSVLVFFQERKSEAKAQRRAATAKRA